MQIEIAPETERLMREELRNSSFRSMDDLIVASIYAWRERNVAPMASPGGFSGDREEASPRPDNLSDLLLKSPFAGANLSLERVRDYPRQIDLE